MLQRKCIFSHGLFSIGFLKTSDIRQLPRDWPQCQMIDRCFVDVGGVTRDFSNSDRNSFSETEYPNLFGNKNSGSAEHKNTKANNTTTVTFLLNFCGPSLRQDFLMHKNLGHLGPVWASIPHHRQNTPYWGSVLGLEPSLAVKVNKNHCKCQG